MRTRSSSWWLLIAVLAIATALPIYGQAPRESRLVAAAQNGDAAAVRALIAARTNVNETSRDGSTALLWAAYQSDVEMAQSLLAAGAKPNLANRYGITPLLQASRTGDAAMMAALIKGGANAKPTSAETETPLMAAARTGRLDAVRLLLEAGADVNATDTYQEQTALMWAAAEGHVEVTRALLAAGGDPNLYARASTIYDRKHADHASGGFTALMFAVRNGHEDTVKALVAGGADINALNGDGVTPMIVAITNDRFDLARTLLDLGANPKDGSLYFAVDMHDATTDMRAKDGSRLRSDHRNTITALDLIALLLERGADPNAPFVGQLHSTTLCCGEEINASPFYRAAIAADVEALKLMLAHGAKIDWTPEEIKKDGKVVTPGRGMNANAGKTPAMVAMNGGRGAPFNAGPGFERLGPPTFREPATREPLAALKVLLQAGADPNAKNPDGATLLHQAVTARQVAMIRTLVAAGAKLDATNKDNLTPLLLAEKPEVVRSTAANTDPAAVRVKRDSREEVIAALRELMKLGPDDPAPVPPPLPVDPAKKAAEPAADAPSAQGAR
jgi:ankyrin repeat protein